MQTQTIYLLRHGETDWNITGRLQGHTNEAKLTETGKNQAANAGKSLQTKLNGRMVEIWSSDLRRAKETAEIIASCLSYSTSNIQYDQGLREAYHGALNGLFPKEYEEIPSYKRYKNLPLQDQFFTAMDPEKGESYNSLAARSLVTLNKIATSSSNKAIIIITHGGVIKSTYFNLKKDFNFPLVNNCEGLIIEGCFPSSFTLETFIPS